MRRPLGSARLALPSTRQLRLERQSAYGKGGVPAWRHIAGLVQYAGRPIANTNSYTQVQSRKAIFVHRSAPSLRLIINNVLTSANGDVAMPDATWRVSLYDPATATYYPANFNGAASITLTSGKLAASDNIALPVVSALAYPAAKMLYLIKWVTYATAPANFPASSYVATAGDVNEWGNALVDKTNGGAAWTITRPAGNWDLCPVQAVVGQGAAAPVVAILGDSISSDSVGDTLNDYLSGWTTNGLDLAGIPYINVGVSSLALVVLMSGGQSAKLARIIALMVAAGVTHCLCPLGTNDWAPGNGPQTGTQVYANMLLLKAALDAVGIKLIITTLQPKTNATNDGMNGSETATFTERAAYNALVIAGNGVGYGYFDVAARTQSAANANLWRSDLNQVTAVTVASGGAGYTQGDILNLPGGIRVSASTVTAGVITGATLRRGGGFVFAPASPAAVVSGLNMGTSVNAFGLGGPTAGSGATFGLTTAVVALASLDGIHPGPAIHSLLGQDFAAAGPTLFAA